MSSTTSLPEMPRPAALRHPALRIVYYGVCLVLVLLIAAIWWLYFIAHSAVPQMDGTISVPGISAKVRVVRDQRGVPTIEAATLEDLFFAQGYVTAQDRLWQMDMMRRAAGGELSEVVGEATVKMDREERTLGLRGAAEASEKQISARDRAYFEAYARGVNAFLESHRDHLSLEFRLMKYTPRPWTVTDSLLVGARMVQDLNHYSNPPALTREKVLAKLGSELTGDLYVNSSWRDRPPTTARRIDEDPAVQSGDEDNDDDEEVDPDGANSRITLVAPDERENRGPEAPQYLSELWESDRRRDKSGVAHAFPQRLKAASNLTADTARVELVPFPKALEPEFLRSLWNSWPSQRRLNESSYAASVTSFIQEESDAFRQGSNDWVISGAHTITGKPLLSNDMHLDHQMPNLWFAAHLKLSGGDFDVAGVTLPGVPFVIVGHNQRIGWGFTNVGPTVEDEFIEEFNAQGQYKTPAGWVEPQHRPETIHVKGKPDVTFDVLTTRHGPIITDLLPGETRKIALRWTLQDGEGLVFFDVNSAHNWQEFRKAFSNFVAPGQNVMYADVDGHIGYQATGRVPNRAAGDGSLPVSGSDNAHEWTGWIPFDEMPRVYDPPSGILATANGRITPDDYKYSISTEWEAPWRTDRIYRVLESGKKFGPADMLALQMDVSSTYDRLCADKFVYAIDHAANPSERAKRAADILRDWDGRMSADSAAPTIETKARQELVRLLLEPKLGAADSDVDTGALSWKSYHWAMSSVWLENVLSKQPQRWLPAGYFDYGALLTTAVENVVKRGQGAAADASKTASTPHSDAPADLSQWKWGQSYPVEIDHLVLSQLPLIGGLTGPGLHPLSGSGFTVKAVGRGFGPSERITWNFANFDESTLNLVTGESGIFLSPYYMDQWKAWYGGSTFAFAYSKDAVDKQRAHEMTLVPR
jgi:penicillin amidase